MALRVSLLHDMARGMFALHAHLPRAIVHRDLKSLNVLVFEASGGGRLVGKIADFGLAHTLSTSTAASTKTKGGQGSAAWMAPEVYDAEYSEKSDVWAFGMVAFEVIIIPSEVIIIPRGRTCGRSAWSPSRSDDDDATLHHQRTHCDRPHRIASSRVCDSNLSLARARSLARALSFERPPFSLVRRSRSHRARFRTRASTRRRSSSKCSTARCPTVTA